MTEDEARAILEEDNDDYAIVEDERVIDTSRWHIHYAMIVQHKTTLEYFMLHYSRGATEYQDVGIENIDITKVKPKERIAIEWVAA